MTPGRWFSAARCTCGLIGRWGTMNPVCPACGAEYPESVSARWVVTYKPKWWEVWKRKKGRLEVRER